jgi:adenylosuccinate synthase
MTKSNNNEVMITQARIQSETIKKLATLREAKKKIKEEIKNCYSELFTQTMMQNVEREMKMMMDDIAIVINDDLEKNDDIIVDGPAPERTYDEVEDITLCQYPFHFCRNKATHNIRMRAGVGTKKLCSGCFADYRRRTTPVNPTV